GSVPAEAVAAPAFLRPGPLPCVNGFDANLPAAVHGPFQARRQLVLVQAAVCQRVAVGVVDKNNAFEEALPGFEEVEARGAPLAFALLEALCPSSPQKVLQQQVARLLMMFAVTMLPVVSF